MSGVAEHRWADRLAGIGVPHPDGVIVAARNDPAPIRTKRHGGHFVGMAGQRCADLLTRVGIPHPQGVVVCRTEMMRCPSGLNATHFCRARDGR